MAAKRTASATLEEPLSSVLKAKPNATDVRKMESINSKIITNQMLYGILMDCFIQYTVTRASCSVFQVKVIASVVCDIYPFVDR